MVRIKNNAVHYNKTSDSEPEFCLFSDLSTNESVAHGEATTGPALDEPVPHIRQPGPYRRLRQVDQHHTDDEFVRCQACSSSCRA